MKLRDKPYILLPLGIVNLTIHIPALLLTSLWAMVIIGMTDWPPANPDFWTAIMILPFFLPVVTCTAGIILPSLNRLRGRPARLCFIFSLVGVTLYVAMFAAVAWVGGRF